MKILSSALLAILALAVVPVASASAATVGGGTAATMPQPDEFSRLFAACLDTRDANSDECYRAQEVSGLGPDEFFDMLMRKLDALAEQPKAEPKTPDAWALMKECAGTRDFESDACRHFIDATDMSGDEVARLAESAGGAARAAGHGRQEDSYGRDDRHDEGLRGPPRRDGHREVRRKARRDRREDQLGLPEGDARVEALARAVLVEGLRLPLLPVPLPAR